MPFLVSVAFENLWTSDQCDKFSVILYRWQTLVWQQRLQPMQSMAHLWKTTCLSSVGHVSTRQSIRACQTHIILILSL